MAYSKPYNCNFFVFYIFIIVKVVKNKVAPPFKTAVVEIMYGLGISKESEIVDLAVESESFAANNYGVHKNVVFEVLRVGK